MARRKLVVVAFGGNALIRHGEDGSQAEQVRNAARLARSLVPLVRRRWDLVLVHGNGPQVGNLLIRMEEAVTKVPPLSLDYCVAQSQGEIGYFLEMALVNRFRSAGVDRRVTTLLTRVVVDPEDPAFGAPSKPIGPFLSRYRANHLRKEKRGAVVEDAGRGYRQVVPSPRPKEVRGLSAVRRLLEAGYVVITGGGGGIPVATGTRGDLQGLEAVIDKDFTAGMIARELRADALAILTDVDHVYLNYGRKNQRGITRLAVKDARRHLEAGQFPAGSMGPKVETAVEFVERTGGEAFICRPTRLRMALQGRAGTRISLRRAPVRQGGRTR
ncbi:MAG: carbamate kinase [Acidobacteriota bacterium]|jgi:carbamate kinase